MRETISPPLVKNTDDPSADDHTTLNDEQVTYLGKVSAIVKDRMQRHGKALIGFQPVTTTSICAGSSPSSPRVLPNCWRMVVAGAREGTAYTDAYIDQLLDDMMALSQDL